MREYLARVRSWIRMLLREHLTPGSIGLAVGIGIFVGCMPIYGLHIVTCVALARWLKLNQALMYAAANISNPFFAPFLISAEIALGKWLRYGAQPVPTDTLQEEAFWTMLQKAPDVFVSCCIGSVVIGTVLGIVLGLCAMLAARRWPRPAPEAGASA